MYHISKSMRLNEKLHRLKVVQKLILSRLVSLLGQITLTQGSKNKFLFCGTVGFTLTSYDYNNQSSYLITLIYISYISEKKFLIPSSFLRSWSNTNLIREAVIKPDTNQSLNLSTILRCILLVLQACSSMRSSAACAMNWLR